MTKQEAIEILRRNKFEDDIDKLIEYTSARLIDPRWFSFDEFKSIIEAISDGDYTIKHSEPREAYGYYTVDIVGTKPYYSEYWS